MAANPEVEGIVALPALPATEERFELPLTTAASMWP